MAFGVLVALALVDSDSILENSLLSSSPLAALVHLEHIDWTTSRLAGDGRESNSDWVHCLLFLDRVPYIPSVLRVLLY